MVAHFPMMLCMASKDCENNKKRCVIYTTAKYETHQKYERLQHVRVIITFFHTVAFWTQDMPEGHGLTLETRKNSLYSRIAGQNGSMGHFLQKT